MLVAHCSLCVLSSAALSLFVLLPQALMGRAKYFEYDGKILKAIQALDSICKIYPSVASAAPPALLLLFPALHCSRNAHAARA